MLQCSRQGIPQLLKEPCNASGHIALGRRGQHGGAPQLADGAAHKGAQEGGGASSGALCGDECVPLTVAGSCILHREVLQGIG